RDSESLGYAKSIGVRRPEFFPDLAWLLPKAGTEAARGNDVVISFRESTNLTERSPWYRERLISTLDQVLAQLLARTGRKLIVAHQVDYDRDFCRDLYRRYSSLYPSVLVENKLDLRSMGDIYRRASWVVSNRLHVLLFGMLHGAAPLGVSDASKHRK